MPQKEKVQEEEEDSLPRRILPTLICSTRKHQLRMSILQEQL